MENETYNSRRGRSGSRASSTSSSLEVRCACQYYRSDSLLPERSALAAASRPAVKQHGVRMVQTPPAGRRPPVRCGDHEYEPIGAPPIMRMAISQHSVTGRLIAPVVKITDTDVIPVMDSDDSVDDRYRFTQRALILEGDVILPLDGRIEDNEMDGRNLGDQTIDTSADELEIDTMKQLQDSIEERFQAAYAQSGSLSGMQNGETSSPTPTTSSMHGLQQKLKSQAGRLSSRFKNIKKPTMPTFSMPHVRSKPSEKPTPEPVVATEAKPPSSPREQRASRMERFRMALPERPRFSLPDKSKFHLPDRSKFHLPDKSKFHLPECPKLNLPDKSKFHIKKPNIHLPKSLSRPRRTESQRVAQPREESQVSNDADAQTGATRRNLFDFSTYPRPKLFDRKAKAKAEYVTSSPKESRAQSTESSTFPRTKKSSLSLSARWAQRFGETRGIHDDDEAAVAPERAKPWRHPSLEKPRLSLKPQTSEEEEEKLPWENTERRTYEVEEVAYDEEANEEELSYGGRAESKEPEISYDKEPIKDPRSHDEQLMKRIEAEEPKKKVRLVEEEEEEGSIIDPEAEDDSTYHPRGLYDGSFPPVDPPDFRGKPQVVEISEDEEEESMRSDREIQQSSGSSCERRRRGVIEEIDSDEFFLREKGISQENMRFQLISEIRDALSARNALANEVIEDIPPVRPKRTRSLRKRKEESMESFDATPPPEKPKRERSLLRSQESFGQQSLDRGNSLSTHRIVYQTEASVTPSKDELESEPLDDIVVVKPVRRKSRSSLRSQSQGRLPPEEQNIVLAPLHPPMYAASATSLPQSTPPVPTRRKRLRRDYQSSSLSIRTDDSALCNGYGDHGSLNQSHERIPPTPPPTPPPESREEELEFIERVAGSAPVPPKRTRSHSRTASLAAFEDDRTSHGADSLPGDFGYADEGSLPTIPRDSYSSSREPSLPGYAVIEKKEKPPRPPPPRRKKHDKFATAPRPAKNGPKRPIRGYSTLRPAKSDTIRKSVDSIPFMDGDYDFAPPEDDDDDFHKDLRSGEVLSRMQTRPLPAPPRPPRHRRSDHMIRRSLPREITPDFSETVASTQTDPLPDDLVIEEEITTAKLVVVPSRSGSQQVLISAERVPSPTDGSYKSVTTTTPPIPPLPSGGQQQRDADRPRAADTGESEQKPPPYEEPTRRIDTSQLELLRSALFSTEEPLRIPSLEVGDLKVERLTVSQLEAYKVAASEIDAIVVSATELSSKSETEGGIHPSLLQELIAIRNQLEAVAASQPQSRPQSAMEDASTATSNERIDAALDELARSTDRQLFEIKRTFSRESSPLLIVEPPSSYQAIDVMGRTVLPQSTSITDLTSTSDSPTVVSEITAPLVVADSVEEPVIKISEPTDEPTSVDQTTTAAAVLASTTTTSTTTAAASELPITRSTSRSRSPSPSRGGLPGAVRQTASPVKSLPPVISVTPDSITSTTTPPDNMPLRHVTSSGAQPQRAVISYRSSYEDSPSSSSHPSREASQSPPPPPTSSPARESSRPPSTPNQQTVTSPQFIAFPTSQIPASFFSLANPPLSSSATTDQQQQQQHRRDVEVEPSIADMTGQLLRALRHAGNRSLRQFVDSVVSRFGGEEEPAGAAAAAGVAPLDDNKVRRVELAMCALLILIAALIVVVICNPRTVTHHHHWDYFNPPQ